VIIVSFSLKYMALIALSENASILSPFLMNGSRLLNFSPWGPKEFTVISVLTAPGWIEVTCIPWSLYSTALRTSYSGSKCALGGFFDSVRAEYSDQGISITSIHPGAVNTDITVNSFGPKGEKFNKRDPFIKKRA